MTNIPSIIFNRTRDDNYERLYRYLTSCEVSGEALKVKRIVEILERSDATVYNRIRRHWNEFIFRNNQQEGRSQYIVKGLRGVCPRHYFVLAHRHRQTKYFFLFQTAILKHERHLQRLRDRKNQEIAGKVNIPIEELDDGIPPIIDDEGNELPEDKYPTPSTFDEEDEEVDSENEDEEKIEEDGEVPELIQLVYSAKPAPASVYVQPSSSEQEAASSEEPMPMKDGQEALDLEGKNPDSSSDTPPKSILWRLLGVALILIAIIVIVRVLFFPIK